ncbi:MAG: bifunctional adenosylcobinamide kinase/adenosylcobinamide-phosphate guanylyltransferase [Saccharofermentanales bacterium]
MIVLVTGGASCGKSDIAENIAMNFGGKKCYIATMNPFGDEGRRRVERHAQLRSGKGFDTIEKYTSLSEVDCGAYDTVLLECISNLLANEYFGEDGVDAVENGGDEKNNPGEKAFLRITEGIRHLKDTAGNLVIVTNDIFSDGITYDNDTMRYMECLGKVNRFLAAEADAVIESVCGIPVFIKGAAEV